MSVFLLAIIYVTFISLGLPDSVLGAAWPTMHGDLGAAVSSAGILSMIVTAGTVVSSLLTDRLVRRFGVGVLTACSVCLTAAALLGFSVAPSFWALCLLALPLGLGAGAVDAGLNNFVALHYEARHMSWLHCFWGIGVTASPALLSVFLGQPQGWRQGYRVIGVLQCILSAVLLLTLPLWRKNGPAAREDAAAAAPCPKPLSLPLAKPAMLGFLCYCGLETLANLWSASFLVNAKGLSPQDAARWVSLFFFGITLGRFLAGFATMRLSNQDLIRLGHGCALAGILLLFLPGALPAAGLFLLGLGCAPIYPCTLHETPVRFGAANAQSLMGLQMACAYVGSTLAPPAAGALTTVTGFGIIPVLMLIFLLGSLLAGEYIRRALRARA